MEKDKINENKELFSRLLVGTGRDGIEEVLKGIGKLGFYEAPASAKHHLAEEGGLLQHSLNVYEQAMQIRAVQVKMLPGLEGRLWPESVAIAALLHDVCKADIYRRVEKFRKDSNGAWEKYLAYEQDQSHCPLGHGEKSVIRLLRMGLDLTEDEIYAIRWHMAGWDLSDYRESRDSFGKACDKCPLLSVIIAADELATRITENIKWDVR